MIAHRSATSRKVAALLAVLVASLCVSPSLALADTPAAATGDVPPVSPSLAPADAPAAPTGDLPQGKLTAAEYQALLRSERLSNKSEKARSSKKGLALAKAGCAELGKVDTPLLVADHLACDAAVGWLLSISRIEHQANGCGGGENADPLACLADIMGAMAAGADDLVLKFGALNQEIDHRSLPTTCARQISLSGRDLDGLKHVAREARAMEAALRSGDKKAIARAGKRFAKLDSEMSGGDRTMRVKRCPHAAR